MTVTDEIGRNIDQLLDVKLMVIRQFEERPELATRAFLEVGQRELRLMINFGFLFGFLFGLPVVLITHWFPVWWVLPVCGVVVGWMTNLLGMQVIFEPVEPRQVGPFRFHGLFLRRRSEVADIYSGIIADDVVTLGNVGEHLMHGPRSDRTRQMLETALRPAVDQATGPARSMVRVAVGASQYDSISKSVASEAAENTMTRLADPEFSEQQSSRIRTLLAARMREMSYPDFVELLRSAIKEDEWMLYAHGAVLGFGAGLVHLALFGV